MWRPGFNYLDAMPALLVGYHRAFCILSRHHRGTPEQPGLVLGLDRGGSCRGVAFRIAAAKKSEVRAYLNERELAGYAYRPMTLSVEVSSGSVEAYTFVADPRHDYYAGNLDIQRAAEMIMNARGVAGLNRDYLINTVRQLEQLGFVDSQLHGLLQRIEYLTGVIEAGGGI
ncbi:MAG: gamma-glutamylcyclotransferase [Rhodospirillales bacterium]|nr:gamma-glutamylcyclotransferase [Rhodospirillales bacterium]